MKNHRLLIETYGICTHFTHGVVAGVPHRIVLPYTTHIQAGAVTLPDQKSPDPVLYYLIPHFPQIDVFPDTVDLTIPQVVKNGDIMTGVRLQVINCIDEGVRYGNDDGPRLTTYYPDYTPSSDVVWQGRAACYFDVYGGTVSYFKPKKRRAGHFIIEMQTEGLPELLVTPLTQSSGDAPAVRLMLPEPDNRMGTTLLRLKNVEPIHEKVADAHFGAFDFMLHYLTAQGGIPVSLAEPTPGMSKHPRTVSRERMALALRELADLVATADDQNAMSRRQLQPESDLTPSCSASQYP